MLSALISLIVIWMIIGNILADRHEKAVARAWIELTGTTPESFIRNTPRTEKNDAARRMEEMDSVLEMEGPNYQIKGVSDYNFGFYNDYLSRQIQKPDDIIDEPPENIKDYLKRHASELDAIYSYILQQEAPRWDEDPSQGIKSPILNVYFNIRYQEIIALDILNKTRNGKSKEAIDALTTSWKISQPLRTSKSDLGQVMAQSCSWIQSVLLRKMDKVPPEWEQEITRHNYCESFLDTLSVDAYMLSTEIRRTPWYKWPGDNLKEQFAFSPIGRAYLRLCASDYSDSSRRLLARLKLQDICSFDPDIALREKELNQASWNILPLTTSSNRSHFRIWADAAYTELACELTQKVIHVKLLQLDSKDKNWLTRIPGSEPSRCSSAVWLYHVSTDGSVSISLSDIPKWLAGKEWEKSKGKIPLNYTITTRK